MSSGGLTSEKINKFSEAFDVSSFQKLGTINEIQFTLLKVAQMKCSSHGGLL